MFKHQLHWGPGELKDSSAGAVLFIVGLWHFLKHGKLLARATQRQKCIPSAGFRAWDWGWDMGQKPWRQSRLEEVFHPDPILKDSGPAAPGMQGWHQGTELPV